MVISSGQLAIDPERYLVTVGGDPVHLTYLEFNALYAIAKLEGRIATYDQLTRALWNENSLQTRRRLTVLISRLRSKLGDQAGARVDTVMRVGYRLAEPTEAA
jgi:DNA-binding response OmpR family regulator